MDAKRYLQDALDTDLSQHVLLVTSQANEATREAGDVTFSVSLVRKRPLPGELYFDRDEPVDRKLFCRLRFYSGGILQMLVSTVPRYFPEDSPMLEWDPGIQPVAARLEENAGC